jgi:uncharacterized protein (UPF0332 family)
MAIINTFRKCLESPYLFEDKDAPTRIGGLLAAAGDRLDAAVNIQTSGQGDLADASLLAYEAMFACLRALVYHKGYREAGLRCLLLACEDLYVKPGTLDAGLVHAFERAQGLKTPTGRDHRRRRRAGETHPGVSGSILRVGGQAPLDMAS